MLPYLLQSPQTPPLLRCQARESGLQDLSNSYKHRGGCLIYHLQLHQEGPGHEGKGATGVQEKVSSDSHDKTKLRAEDRESPAQPHMHTR